MSRRRPGARGQLSAARAAVTAFFALDGFVFTGWVVRIPAVKSQVGADSGALGLALLGVSAGAVVSMLLAERLCRRLGSHRVTIGGGALLSLTVALPPQTHSVLALGLVLLLFGAAYGVLDVGMNSCAVDLVAALRRPVMPGFHAAYSFGGLLGSGLGGLLAAQLSAAVHLALLVPAGLLTTAVAGRVLLTHPVAPAAPPPPVSSPAPTGGVLRLVVVFGLVALCTAYGEGALADWSALHFTQDLHAGPGLAAAAYAPFALAMSLGRLRGTFLLERFGDTRVVVAGGLLAAVGVLVSAFSPVPWLVLTGLAAAGLGLANIFPVAMARAGALAGPTGVAVGSALGYLGMLLGPPAIGFLAEEFGLPAALTTIAVLAGVSSGIAFAVRGVRA